MSQVGLLPNVISATKAAASTDGFFALDTHTIKAWVAAQPQLAAHVGPAETADSWAVCEVGLGWAVPEMDERDVGAF